MTAKEFELYDTKRQYRIGCYRNQSNMLGAVYEQLRLGINPDHLDCFLQRRDDKPIFLVSGRDEEFRKWLDNNVQLEVDLRLAAETDVLGVFEFIQYDLGHPAVCEDNPLQTTPFDYQRYLCTVTDGEHSSSARGATETEGTTRAYLAFKRRD